MTIMKIVQKCAIFLPFDIIEYKHTFLFSELVNG